MKGLCLGMVATGGFLEVGRSGDAGKGGTKRLEGPTKTHLSPVVSARCTCSGVHPGRMEGSLGRGYLLPGTHVHVNVGKKLEEARGGVMEGSCLGPRSL